MLRNQIFPFLVFSSGLLLSLVSCKHDPFMTDVTPVDSTGNPIDTTGMGEPCDPDVVYFELQVLPLLQSNCAFSGCHDAASAEDGVILISYESVMATADVEAFDLDNSEIYEVLVDDDPDDRMPLDRAPLSADQINLIARWILQGAENLSCDPGSGGCDTENVSFAADVRPVIQNKCQGCHSGNAPSGGVNLSSHSGVATVANDGRLFGVISHAPGFPAMPQGGNQLPQCNIDQIKAWIDAGAPNN